jgi:glutamate---cysteine ligase / carboxylate-amine ligase
MPVEFKGSPEPTLGLKLELQLINPETKELVPRSIEVLERCRKLRLQRIKAEITQSMVEIDTEISNDVKECRAYLEKRLRQLRAVKSGPPVGPAQVIGFIT